MGNIVRAGKQQFDNIEANQTDGTQKTQIHDATSGLDAGIKANPETGNNELLVNLEGHVCSDNTTSTPLGVDTTFTGAWQDTLDYGAITISVLADEDSATDGLVIEWSPDQTNISGDDKFTILADIGKTFTFGPADRYVRLKYTNGGTEQTSFYLNTILRRVYVKPSSHRINDSIVGQDDAELVKAVLTGENPAGTFVNFQSTTAGNFKVSVEEYESDASPFRTDMEGGGKVSVGTTATEVTFTGTTKSIIITADIDNSGTLYVGKSNVTSAGANALTFLLPGDSLTIDYDDTDNAVYVVGSEASQNFWKGALL